MNLPKAQLLIEMAAKGEKLSAPERRHAVSFLMATQPELSQTTLAEMFRVSTRQIRYDIDELRKNKADILKNEDIGLVVADIALTFDRTINDMIRSKNKAKEGTPNFLQHCKGILDYTLKKVEALQSLGFYPKDLGTITKESFEFKAEIVSGQVKTGPVVDVTPVVSYIEPADPDFSLDDKTFETEMVGSPV